MTTDNRPTPPERIYIDLDDIEVFDLTEQFQHDHTYRFSDPADPLVRLSDVVRAVRLSLGCGGDYKAAGDNIIDECRRLTAERGGEQE